MKKIINNFMYQFLYQLTVIILPIISIPIVSHSLGVEGLGVYNYITSIVTYFVLLSGLGLANYGVREVAQTKDSLIDRSIVFWELELFNVIIVTLVILGYIFMLFFVNNRLYYSISLIVLLANLFDISWFYRGIENFKNITLVNIFVKVIGFLSIIIFIKGPSDLAKYFFIQGASILLSNISLWFFLKNQIIWIKPSLNKSIKHLKPAFNYFLGKISITLYTTLNKTLLGIFTGVVAVGLYTNSLQLIVIIVTLIGTIDAVLLPHMTKLFSESKEKKMLETMENFIDIQLFFSIPLMFGLVLVNDKLIPWFFGNEFNYLKYTVPVLAPLIVIMPLGLSIVRQYLIPMNKIREFNISVLLAAASSIITNLIFLPVIGIWGAIISTLISESIVTVIRVVSLLRHTNFKFKFGNISVYTISSILMFVFTYYLTKYLSYSIKTTVLQVFVGFFIYMVSTIVMKKNVLYKLFRKKIYKEK